jgi:cell division protein ZapE
MDLGVSSSSPSRLEAEGEGPLALYRAKLARGELATDPAQALVAEKLQDLWAKLDEEEPPSRENGRPGLLARLFRRKAVEEAPLGRQGLYIAGPVGRGKSTLMDMFFATARLRRKRRWHFHQFMQQVVHARIHAWKASHPGGDDPIPALAESIAAEAALLCFDEFQINDIADGMLLGRLFEALFEKGGVIVLTSNVLPDDLLADQPGRDAFRPFIALLKERLDLVVMEEGRDWRRRALARRATWLTPPDAAARAALDEIFAILSQGETPRPARLPLLGRSLEVPLATRHAARFSFAALCGEPLGPADYLRLATHYPALVIDAIPRLGPDAADRARRFITLVDALYEHRVKLFASAEAAPDALYTEGAEAEAFRRTASRLVEMQSEAYFALPHLT